MAEDNPKRPITPNLDRMIEVKEQAQIIGEFIQWLASQNHFISGWDDVQGKFIDTEKTTEDLIAGFFKVDLAKTNKETEALIKLQREMNKNDKRKGSDGRKILYEHD